MTLRDKIIASPETLSDVVWAAEQRFRDGEELLTAHRHVGAVYLLGLASEMWLKAACFRLRGARPADRLFAQLGPAKAWMSGELLRLGRPSVSNEAYHSLLFWAEMLLLLRSRKTPLSKTMAGQLRHHVIVRLYSDWKIDLRYSAIPLSAHDALRVYNDTSWLRATWQQLGS